MKGQDNMLGVLRSLWRWRRPVLGVTLAAALISAVISLLVPVYYEATTVFLAASPDQAKPEILYSQGSIEPEYYGNQADIDRLLTLSRSRTLLDYLIGHFGLMAHYDIDPDRPRAAHRTRKALLELFEVTKTERDAIEMSVQDKDPDLAAALANAAREKLDELAQAMVRVRQQRVLEAYRANVQSGELRLALLADTLAGLREQYGIYNVEAQSESLTEQAARAEARLVRSRARLALLQERPGFPSDSLARLEADVSGLRQQAASLKQQIQRFNSGLASFQAFNEQFQEVSQGLGRDQERLQQLRSTTASTFPAVILVEAATVPEIKARPHRTLIVAASTLLALLFSLSAVLLLDAYRDINWRSITHVG